MIRFPKRTVNTLLLISLMVFLTGCWDRIEINDRVFVLALAVDKFEPGMHGGNQDQDQLNNGIQQPGPSPRNRMIVSIVFPNVGLLKDEGVIVSEEAKFAVSTVAPNIFEAVRQLNTRLNGNIFFGHINAVLLGEELVSDRELFLQVLDELERSHEIARNVNFITVKGEAKEALFIKPLVEPIIGTYVEQIIKERRTGRLHGKDLGQIVTSIRETGGALMPRMVVGERELKIAGSCLIKNYKHRAWLGELETQAAQWLDNTAREDIITVEVEGVSVPFELTELKRRMGVRRDKDGSIHLGITLEAEGNIAGHTLKTHQDVMGQDFIRKMEKAVERDITAQCIGVMNKMQHEFRLDIWGIGDHIRKHHPKIWDDVKDPWERNFTELKVHISADVKVRRVGIIK